MGKPSRNPIKCRPDFRDINRFVSSRIPNAVLQIILGKQRASGKECWVGHAQGLPACGPSAKIFLKHMQSFDFETFGADLFIAQAIRLIMNPMECCNSQPFFWIRICHQHIVHIRPLIGVLM